MEMEEVDEVLWNEEIEEEKEEEEMDDEELEKHDSETIKILLMATEAIAQVLNVLMALIHDGHIERSLARRPISTIGYNYINKVLNEDPQHFRQLYRMYPDVFLKLCGIIREKTHLHDTRFICIEEMLATFLLTIGQNSRYCQTRDTFERSHFTTSKNFNNVLKALNTIAPETMVKPGSTVPAKIRERLHNFLRKECRFDEFPIEETTSIQHRHHHQKMREIIMTKFFKPKNNNARMLTNGGLGYLQICGEML
ncbi:unnamed protein product [Prunus armeniaca]